jgi:exosortase H (IPTLxxWG-CTERM-specific)
MARFLFLFCGVLAALFAIEMLKPVQEAVIQPFTGLLATLSTAVILPFDDTVIAQGRVLRDPTTGFSVSNEAGCNGVEAAIVLIAGIVAFPASVKNKVVAILAGFLFVQALNIVRIISLFYLGQWNYTVFEWFHLYLWPVLIMLDVLIVFAVYLQWLGKQNTQPEPA